MKTRKMYLTTLVLAIVFGTTTYAGDNSAVMRAERNLKLQLQKEFKQLPFEDISGLEDCCMIYVKFTVDENSQIEVENVESENQDLLRFAEVILNKNRVKADNLLQGKTYKVRLRFVDKA
jgi:hypothetical protein